MNEYASKRAAPHLAKIGWRPGGPELGLFATDVESTGYGVFDQGKKTRMTWPAP